MLTDKDKELLRNSLIELGALPVEDFVNALKQVASKEGEPIKEPHAHVCGPDGCQLL